LASASSLLERKSSCERDVLKAAASARARAPAAPTALCERLSDVRLLLVRTSAATRTAERGPSFFF
jgi:hypothetical protein